MGIESSDEQPAVKRGGTERLIRRWEDKVVGILGVAVVGLLCFMWQGLSAQITKLEEARTVTETKIAVQHEEIKVLKESMADMKGMLKAALEIRR